MVLTFIPSLKGGGAGGACADLQSAFYTPTPQKCCLTQHAEQQVDGSTVRLVTLLPQHAAANIGVKMVK